VSQVAINLKAALGVLAKKDPGIGKLIAIADAEFVKWATPSPKRTELISAYVTAQAAVASNSRAALAACEQKNRSLWSANLKSVKLPEANSEKQFISVLDAAISSNDGYLAYSAFMMCATGKLEAPLVGQLLVRRGPRSATVASWLSADEIGFDDRSLSLPTLLSAFRLKGRDGYYDNADKAAVIGKVTVTNGEAEVVFKTVKERRVTCANWVKTNRIESIRDNGMIEYV
jgi:hypothetical protein